MAEPSATAERRKLIWTHVGKELFHHAVPDSRFNFDFLAFTPDFRGSSLALDQLVKLPCYQAARTILITPDNSLEGLRYRALKDGKKVLVATYRLRRGFVLLNPAVIDDEKYELVACLDGMEKPGLGRAPALAQLNDEKLQIDLCCIGGLAFNHRGVTVWEGQALFEVQWAMLHDIGCLTPSTPVVALAHSCQVVDEVKLSVEPVKPEKSGEVQCNFVVTPEQVFEIENPVRPKEQMDMAALDEEAVKNIPALQELKGIRMAEKIMRDGRMGKREEEKEEGKGNLDMPEEDELRGIDIVKKLMKGYKP